METDKLIAFVKVISNETMKEENMSFFIGLCLAVSSTIFIGASFIIKKKALIKLNSSGYLRAGYGGFGYLKEWMWWLGLLSMGIGELANFAAYAFAPASLVTPLGALSVLVAAVLSSKYLKERLNLIGQLGCVICILGSTIIVIHSPKQEEITSLDILLEGLQDPLFLLYTSLVVVTAFLIVFYYGPVYGSSNVTVYILLCSTIGSLSVMACKGFGLALKETFSQQNNDFENWLTYAFLVTLVICISIQMNYLNKALDLFNTNIVTPIYYVFFTTFVLIASSILFKEWKNLDAEDIVGNLCGFVIVIIATFMLNAFKDLDITLSSILRPRQTLLENSYDRMYYNSNAHLNRNA